jgi:hypothetical protein
MRTVVVSKRTLEWYRSRGRLVSILERSTFGYLILVSESKE